MNSATKFTIKIGFLGKRAYRGYFKGYHTSTIV